MRLVILASPFVMGSLLGLVALGLVALALLVPDPGLRGLGPIAALPGLMALVLIPLGLIIVVVVRRREARQDAAFSVVGPGAPLGYPSRQWHGVYGGRRVDVYFQKGPTFEIFMEATAGWRGSIGAPQRLGRAIARGLGRSPIPVRAACFEDRAVYTQHPALADALLDVAGPVLWTLTESGGRREQAQVHVRPDHLLWILHRTNAVPSAGRIEEGLAQLSRVADCLERGPRGEETPSSLERIARLERDAMTHKLMFGACGCLAVFVVVASAGSALFAYLSTRH